MTYIKSSKVSNNNLHNNNSSHILSYEEYQEKLKGLETVDDVTDFLRDLVSPVLQEMLENEMTNHLGYEKHNIKGNKSGNSRNGYYQKKVRSNLGQTNIKIPRDREGYFEPTAIKKYSSNASDVEEKIISMYAKGMTTRDINSHLHDIYGIEASASMISQITDKVVPLITDWQNRALDEFYPFVFLDGIHFKVKDNGKIINKCSYTVLAINKYGKKELLGIWIGENEGAKFWLSVLNEIKNRGVEDILICSVDDLKGFSEAIHEIYPNVKIQKCVVHQIRNTVKYVSHKHRKEFCADLKTIYTAPSEEAGLNSLEQVKKNWPDYEIHLDRWIEKWDELSVFFNYPSEVRKIIYTTNAVESLHRQLRKSTKTTSVFPNDDSLKKLLWLSQKDITKKWMNPIPNWGRIISQLAIIHPDRVKL